MTRKSLFVILALAILLAGGWYFVVEKGRPTPASTPATPPVTEEPVTPTQPDTTPIDTSDWKTYRNEGIGIEFKMPKSIVVEKINLGYYHLKNDSGETFAYYLIVYDKFKNEKLKNLSQDDLLNPTYAPYTKVGNIVLGVEQQSLQDGDSATVFTYTFGQEPATHNVEAWIEGYQEQEIFFQCASNICSLKYFDSGRVTGENLILKTIVSTLHFI